MSLKECTIIKPKTAVVEGGTMECALDINGFGVQQRRLSFGIYM